ncbi:MAG: hypothetical protein HC899_35765 [Leptolyngbyaceae cyanobacterium SM1_4_3]|nr:hypothetical protein [Leptolyngbyaceae cyanobacterium SM1_4_3]NJN92058.1 hypothetical protein [Leptolyngbyaceae cyanobacterium SL_5_14]
MNCQTGRSFSTDSDLTSTPHNREVKRTTTTEAWQANVPGQRLSIALHLCQVIWVNPLHQDC